MPPAKKTKRAKNKNSKKIEIGNAPFVVIIGFIASLIGLIVFLSGKQSFGDFFSNSTSTQTIPILVTVIVQPEQLSTTAIPVVLITATTNTTSTTLPFQSITPLPQLEPQFDPNNPEGFLRWYFHEIWFTRNYEYLWTYLSTDFRNRLGLSYSYYKEIWSSIGRIAEPIALSYEGKDGNYLKYRVEYTTFSLKSGFEDNRKDTYWLYFNKGENRWEFR